MEDYFADGVVGRTSSKNGAVSATLDPSNRECFQFHSGLEYEATVI